jgi:hypothetical protein
MIGVPAKRSKSDCLAPFPEAKLGDKLIKNLVFAVSLIIGLGRHVIMSKNIKWWKR